MARALADTRYQASCGRAQRPGREWGKGVELPLGQGNGMGVSHTPLECTYSQETKDHPAEEPAVHGGVWQGWSHCQSGIWSLAAPGRRSCDDVTVLGSTHRLRSAPTGGSLSAHGHVMLLGLALVCPEGCRLPAPKLQRDPGRIQASGHLGPVWRSQQKGGTHSPLWRPIQSHNLGAWTLHGIVLSLMMKTWGMKRPKETKQKE